MSGNTLGTLFSVTTFGESHGAGIGCVVDGCPPGLELSAADIQDDLDRRKPGTSRHVTQRKEPDAVEILSGVFEGKTTGTPIALLIRNQDQRSQDYSKIAETFRPGHADYTYWQKYGIRDHRGGGRQSARETAVARIVTQAGDLALAVAGQAVTLVLADATDVSRGDLICAAAAPAEVADQFEAALVWMHEDALLVGREYWLKLGSAVVPAQVTELKYRINVNSLEHTAAKTLGLNEIGVCNLSLGRPLPFDPYESCRDTGGFILIDRTTLATVGAGMVRFALRRAHNIHLQSVDIDRDARARLKGQRPCIVWFTGLSGAGKSSIANRLEARLHALGRHTYLLDGDNVRHGLNRDLGFTPADRVENIRRIGEVARLMVDAGLIVLTAFISPFRAEREMARRLVGADEFLEVHVDTPLAVAEARDPKGLYAKARRGELRNFTGIDSPYEPPEQPELRLNTAALTVDEAAERVLALLRERGCI